MAKARPEGTVSSKALAEALDCTTRQIEKYAEEGLVIRVGRGSYHFLTSIKNVVGHLRKQASNNMGTDQKTSAADENILFRQSQRRIAEIRIAQMEGRLISMAEIEETWAALVMTNRQAILSIPGRARLEIPAMTGHDHKALIALCHDVLTETSLGEGKRPPIKAAVDYLDDETADA